MEILNNFHFLRPLWLLMLLPSILILFFYRFYTKNNNDLLKAIDPHLLPHILNNKLDNIKKNKKVYLAFLLSLFSISLSGPTFKKIDQNKSFERPPIIVALELSSFMMEEDLTPSRLKRAQFKIIDLLEELGSGQVGLLAFAGDAHMVTPITNDFNTIKSLLNELSPNIMPISGAKMLPMLKLLPESLSGFPKNSPIVILSSLNIEDNPKDIEHYIKSHALNVTIWPFTKKEITTFANIKILPLSDDNKDIKQIINNLSNFDAAISLENNIYNEWQDLGPYILIIAMILFLYVVFITKNPILLSGILVCFFSFTGKAGILDYFTRLDQKNYSHLKKGTDFYQDQKYNEAIKEFSQVPTDDGFYNLGNALAKSKKIDEAIKAYEEALKLNQKHEDALFNKKLLEEQKQQEEKEQKKEEKQEENQDKKEEKKEDKSSNEEEKKTDAGTQYYLDQLENHNNLFLKRKFMYESKKAKIK